MKAKSLISFILLLLSANYPLYAQITAKCANTSFIIPEFKHDTSQRLFTEAQFEKLSILGPIKDSGYDIELRGYYEVVNVFIGSMIVIKCNSKNIFAEAIYYCVQRDVADTIPPKGFKTVKLTTRNVYFSIKSILCTNSLLDSLIKNQLFSLPDISKLKKSLIEKQIKVEDTRAFDPYFMKFELKVNNNYRSFLCDPFAYWTNKGIKELRPEKNLFKLFDDLYIKSGQELNHLFP